MEYKNIGNSKIPVLGMGTWNFVEKMEHNLLSKKSLVNVIQEAIKLGITHIDTSEFYGNGLTEEIIGKAIASFRREDLYITSKIWVSHLNFNDAVKALHGSLKRLKTPYLDLYLIHKPTKDMDLRGTMKALELLKQDGLIRSIGVSNFTKDLLQKAQKYLKKENIDAIQNEYNLLNRDDKILDICVKQKIVLIAYKPFMQGKIIKERIPILNKLGKKYSKTSAQIVLNWLISKPQIVTTPKSTNTSHILENLGSLGWKMTEKDYRALDNFKHHLPV